MAKSRKTGSDQVEDAQENLQAPDAKLENDGESSPETDRPELGATADDSEEATIEDGVTRPIDGQEEDEQTASDDAEAEQPTSDGPAEQDDTLENPDDSLPRSPAPDPALEHEPTPAAVVTERVVVEKRGGFVPMALGGFVAAALGYGAAWYQGQQANQDTLAVEERFSSLETGISDLQAQVEALGDGPDLGPLELRITEAGDMLGTVTGRLDAVQAEVTGGVAGLTDRIAEIDARLTDLEQRPTPTGDGGAALAEEAIAAYEREITALREEMQAQADRLTSMTEAAEAQLQAARDDIIAAEEAAAETARAAEARAALGRIMAAVDTGEPFSNALGELAANTEVSVPAPLAAAADEGVATTRDLQESFGDAARAALAVARVEGVDDDAGGLGGFLRSTFNARSVTPQEGSSPNAILSRVGAAVDEGRITDALAEAETLPEVVRAEMSGWLDAARTRAETLAALESLSQTVNDN